MMRGHPTVTPWWMSRLADFGSWVIALATLVVVTAGLYLLTRTVWPHRNVRPWRTPAAVKALRARQSAPQAPARPAWYRGKHRAPEPDPTPAEPETEPGERVEHEGATDRWADELHQLANEPGHLRDETLPATDLLDVEHDLAEREARIAEFACQPIAWSDDLDAALARFETRMARVEAALAGDHPLSLYRALAVDEPTGQWSTAELRQLLAAEQVPA